MTRTIKIGNKMIGPGQPTMIISETACAHNGSFEEAKQMVDASVEAKADIIHFIIFSTKNSMCPKHQDYKLCETLELNHDEWRELIAYTKTKDILIATTIEDDSSLDLASTLPVDIIKIHSTDNTNPKFMKKAARIGKPMMISVGAMTFEEIEAAINTIKGEGMEDIMLMYGYQNYPTNPEKTNLQLIKTLKERFDLPIGYADHTDGSTELAIYLPLMTIPLGADLIDKHITLDRSKKGADYEGAVEPAGLKKFVETAKLVEKALGDGIRHDFTEEEKQYRKIVKKSIVAAEDLKAGTTIKKEDVIFRRSDKLAIPPYNVDKVVGKKLKKDVEKFESIFEGDLE